MTFGIIQLQGIMGASGALITLEKLNMQHSVLYLVFYVCSVSLLYGFSGMLSHVLEHTEIDMVHVLHVCVGITHACLSNAMGGNHPIIMYNSILLALLRIFHWRCCQWKTFDLYGLQEKS